MEFRYPPIPPFKGFNIFGAISNLTFPAATGTISIGSRTTEVKLPSLIDFRDIQSLDIKDIAKRNIPIPVQLDSAEGYAKIQLKATSQIFLNGESLNKLADEYKINSDYIPYISLVISVLSFLTGIWSIRKNK